MSGYVKAFKVKDGDKDKENKDDDKLLEKYETSWNKIEGLQNIELIALPEYDDRYIKPKIITHGYKIYINFRCLNVPKDGVECKSFIIISIYSLLVYENKFYLQEYLDNCTSKTVNKRMIDYLVSW